MTEDQSNNLLNEKARQAGVVRRIVLIILGICILAAAGIGLGGFLYIHSTLKPVDAKSDKTIQVEIPIGSDGTAIGSILEEKGLIKNGTIFRYYVSVKNVEGLQAGEYRLSPSMNVDEIISALKKGKVMKEAEITFTIPEGTWMQDITKTIAGVTAFEEKAVNKKLHDKKYIKELIDKYSILEPVVLEDEVRHPLEGYLFPARYDYYEEKPKLASIIEKMIERMQSHMVEFSDQLQDKDYTVHEVLTLASIVEREARQAKDRPIIAGVLFNRLEKGMRLEVDPTVAYAIGEHRYMTSFDDLETESPYNTYRYKGLPPGPIASPGLDSIRAVLNPDENNYIYFYARPNGEVIYNEEYANHKKTQEKYRSEWEEAKDE
ncbi:endolytic transglycosylase MltG [Bacillus piscicola]|uniref:endolytic transglycosylase MltG n=1 Tax=Bacillus piscicola TaxID=1632684 RepID=UPI001F08CD7B|nr:endolytic transglycosylase MltG [Bacillus piscicola]